MTHGSAVSVSNLTVEYSTLRGFSQVLHGISFVVRPGRTLALVGESGSGKSTTAMAVAGLLPESARVSGEISVAGKNLLKVKKRELEDLRGDKVAVIFQNPMTSLNPTMRVGTQIAEQLRRHRRMDHSAAKSRTLELLEAVQIRKVADTARKYPHELSGGMRQRIMIAMAISCDPDVLVADEPTTALDVTVQAQILEILRSLRRELGMTLILVTHDMGVVSEMADEVAVMYDGRLVEYGGATSLFTQPLHPYTRGLLEAQPRIEDPQARHRTLPTIPRPAPMLDRLPEGMAQTGARTPGSAVDERYILINSTFTGVAGRTMRV